MQLKRVIDHVYDVLVSRDLYYVNPTNLDAEKAKFLDAIDEGVAYNPVFSYRKMRFDPGLVRREIQQLKGYDGTDKEIIRGFAQRCEDHLGLVVNRGKPGFLSYSVKIFGKPDRKAITYCKRIIKKNRDSVKYERDLKANGVAKILSKNAREYGWSTSLASNLGSRIQLHRSTRTIYLNRNSLFSRKDIKRLIVHEIDTHIRRDFNNTRKIKPVFQKCLDFLETEEGLALKNEEQNGCLDHEALRNYSARLIAIDLSLKKGFSDVFKKIRGYGFNDDEALEIVSRAKRGLSDASKPGAFTRDHIYISGKLKIDEFLTKNHTLEELFVGKIGINDVGNLQQIMKKSINS